MKTVRTPAIVFLLLCLAFVVWVNGTSGMLPERVARHFNAAGEVDAWTNKAGYLSLIHTFGVGLPLFLAAVFTMASFLPDWMINLPHKAIWLAPDRRLSTRGFIIRQSLWLSCLTLLLAGGMHQLTIIAHSRRPVQLPVPAFVVLLGAFLAAMGVWLVRFLHHFARPPASKEGH